MRLKYDASSKWLIETFASELLQLAGVGPDVTTRPVPSELVQSRQLPDGLVEVTYPNRREPVLHLIEVNTYSYAATALDLLDDVLLTYLNRRVVPEVISFTLHDRGNVRVAPSARVTSPLSSTELEGRWRVVNLWELNARDFLPLASPGFAPWLPLMRIDGPPEPVLQQCRDVIDTVPDPGQRENLLGVTQILGGLRFDEGLLTALFKPEGKMIESPVLTKWFRQREAATLHRAILDGLAIRFGSVPDDLSATIRLIDSVERLSDAHRASYTCSSLDDFRTALTPPQPPATP